MCSSLDENPLSLSLSLSLPTRDEHAVDVSGNVARDVDASAEKPCCADEGIVERCPGPQVPVARRRPDAHHVPLPDEARRPGLGLGSLPRASHALVRSHGVPRHFNFDVPQCMDDTLYFNYRY